MTDALKACPFCGAGKTDIHPNGRMWTGQRLSEPTSVSIRHWCEDVPGQPHRMIERVGRDEASAIAAWNSRAAIAAPTGWQPIETAPNGDRQMFVVIAANVAPTPSRIGYTSDPWCVWRNDDGGFARWPHAFGPTHWMPLPAAPDAQKGAAHGTV